MKNVVSIKSAPKISVSAALLSIAATVVAIVCLMILHLVSPEFDPSWRMVSEYALGNYGWVLFLMFIAWAIGAWALAYAIKGEIKTTGGTIGLAFLVLAGIGETMGGIFDVRHSLHGVAFTIGVPSFSIAALLISISLGKNVNWIAAKKKILLTAQLTWISILLTAIGSMLLFSGFSNAGVDMSFGAAPTKLPDGVLAFNGWANRLLIVVYCIWVIFVACKTLSVISARHVGRAQNG